MPAKEQHKIMKHGTSGVVVIPKAYRNYHNLDPGSIVTVLYDSLLIIVPEEQENLLQEKAELINQLLGWSKTAKRHAYEMEPFKPKEMRKRGEQGV